jgi:hypothetical protein
VRAGLVDVAGNVIVPCVEVVEVAADVVGVAT